MLRSYFSKLLHSPYLYTGMLLVLGLCLFAANESLDTGKHINFERPGVQQLLEMVTEGKINTILVKDLSRFGRNSIETGYFIEKVFPLYRVRFISVSDNFDTDEHKGDTGGIDIAFKYLINECYSRDMSVKTRTAKQARMKRGEFQSKTCPYGYQKGADGRMVPDEETAPTVRKIFEWAAEGASAAEITRKLYDLKIPTPAEYKASKGKKYHDISRTNGVWVFSTVLRILADERYIGMYVAGKTIVSELGSRSHPRKDESEWVKIPDHHTPIISQELFERANSNIKRHKLPNKKKRIHLLRGKVFCGCCDHAMDYVKGRHYQCLRYKKINDKPCNGLSIPVKELEQIVFDTINAQAQCVFGIDDLQVNTDINSALQEEHEKKVQLLQENKRALYEQFVLGEINAETYKARKAEIDVKLTYEQNVSETIKSQAKADCEKAEKQQFHKELANEINSTDTLTQSLVDVLIKRVYVFPDNRVELEYLPRTFF